MLDATGLYALEMVAYSPVAMCGAGAGSAGLAFWAEAAIIVVKKDDGNPAFQPWTGEETKGKPNMRTTMYVILVGVAMLSVVAIADCQMDLVQQLK